MQKSCRVSVQPERPQVAVVPRQRLLQLEPPRPESTLARERHPGAAPAAPAILRARVPAKESGTCSIDNDSRVDGSTATVLADLSGSVQVGCAVCPRRSLLLKGTSYPLLRPNK